MLTFDTSDIDRAVADIQDILSDANMTTLFRKVGQAVGVQAEALVSEYPPASGKPLEMFYDRTSTAAKPYRPEKGAPLRTPGSTFRSKFKSARQQGKVFREIKQGKVSYRRTGTLGKSITSQVTEFDARGATVSVGSNIPYAPFVIDQEQQSHYHQGNWTPIQQDITNNIDTLQRAADSVAEKTLDELARGL